MNTIDYLLWGLILSGHVAVWTALFNRVHALDLPCWFVRISEQLFLSTLLLGGIGLALQAATWRPSSSWQTPDSPLVLPVYAFVCAGGGTYITGVWLWRQLSAQRPRELLSNHTECLDVTREIQARPVGSASTRVLDWVPGNQMFELRVHEKRLALATLPEALCGLTIAHVSDLHFSGKIEKSYFDYVIERTNQLDADIVAVTGDILDTAQCLDWVASTLGRLRSRFGCYFVLGNHDKRLNDELLVRRTISAAGLIDLGRQCASLEVRGQRILLAGNELPWFGPPVEMAAEHRSDPSLFRILLSHSPDQLPWARQRGFDLVLSGHTHGGQVRLPFVGPLVAPSAFGVKYAQGVFYEHPSLMHVSRGISAIIPIRINCAPELAKLVLESPAGNDLADRRRHVENQESRGSGL